MYDNGTSGGRWSRIVKLAQQFGFSYNQDIVLVSKKET